MRSLLSGRDRRCPIPAIVLPQVGSKEVRRCKDKQQCPTEWQGIAVYTHTHTIAAQIYAVREYSAQVQPQLVVGSVAL